METILDQFKTKIDALRSACDSSLPPDIQMEVGNQINLFINQFNTLTRLESKYGDALFQTCQNEIEELIAICSDCSSTYKTVNTTEFANKVRENSVRLNILQQRIAGKVFKIKPSSNSLAT